MSDPTMPATPDEEYDRAAQMLDQREAALYRDGRPIHVPAEHARQLAALAEDRQRRLGPIVERVQADAARRLAEAAKLEAGAQADPLLRLSADDLERAGLLASFIREDVARLGPDALAARLAAAEARADALEVALLLRYIDVPADLARLDPGARDDWRALRQNLADARERATPPAARQARERADALRRQAAALDGWALARKPGRQAELEARFKLHRRAS